MRYVCRTSFDITATGVTGHYKPTRGEFHDSAGNYINSIETWNYSRNQQRNWETVMQLIALRTQIIEHTLPIKLGNMQEFEFEVEASGIYDDGDDVVGVLKSDSRGVPMIVNLDNSEYITEIIITEGENQNIWFDVIE